MLISLQFSIKFGRGMVALGLGLDGLAEQICRLSGQGANCSGNYNKRRQMSFQSKHILTRKSVLVSNSLIVELRLAKVNSRSILGYLHPHDRNKAGTLTLAAHGEVSGGRNGLRRRASNLS
jgi:hypothetical protein